MTDTPAADVEPGETAPRGPARWFAGWSETRRRNVFLAGFTLAMVTNIVAVWLVAVAPGAAGEGTRASASQAVLFILIANPLLSGGLTAVVARRAFSLVRRRGGDAGARL